MLVYLVTNKENGKVYVGKTEKTLNNRWRQHIRAARGGSPFRFHKAIRKYGEQGFEVVELCHASSVEELDVLERFFTHLCRATNFALGYNSVVGGGPSDYNRLCTSLYMRAVDRTGWKKTSLKGRKHSPQTLAQMSANRSGRGNANAKLTAKQVDAIIRNPADLEIKELAELYCVCPSTIDKVRAGQRSSFVK